MSAEFITAALDGPWALLAMALLVAGDAFVVILPGEIAVTALGALAVSEGRPPLWSVIIIAAAAAFAGDVGCYVIGRTVGLDRWAWMRRPRIRGALEWAAKRLNAQAGVAVFTARFIPFARLAVNLTAGAARLGPRFLVPAALAACAWASYQAVIGAVLAAFLPGGPVVAVLTSVVVALALGLLLDVLAVRWKNHRTRRPRP